jgi:hypothetical protein
VSLSLQFLENSLDKRKRSRERSSRLGQLRRCANLLRRLQKSRGRRSSRNKLNRSEGVVVAGTKMRTMLRSLVKTVSISILTKLAMPTNLSLSLMRKMRAIMVIIEEEVVTPEVAEEAKEVVTEAETTAEEVGMATNTGEMTAVTKEVTRNVAPEARVEIQDNQETMKKITR